MNAEMHQTYDTDCVLVHPPEVSGLVRFQLLCTPTNGNSESVVTSSESVVTVNVHPRTDVGRGNTAIHLPRMLDELNTSEYTSRTSSYPQGQQLLAPSNSRCEHRHGGCTRVGVRESSHMIPVPLTVGELESGINTPGEYDCLLPPRLSIGQVLPDDSLDRLQNDRNLVVRIDNPTEPVHAATPDNRFSPTTSEKSRFWTKKTCVLRVAFAVMAFAVVSLTLAVGFSATRKYSTTKTPAAASQTLSEGFALTPIAAASLILQGSTSALENRTSRTLTTSTIPTLDCTRSPSMTVQAVSTTPSTAKTDPCAQASEVVCKLIRSDPVRTIQCTVGERNASLAHLAMKCILDNGIIRSVEYSRCCCCQMRMSNSECWRELPDAIYN